jgi:hypothetical protein
MRAVGLCAVHSRASCRRAMRPHACLVTLLSAAGLCVLDAASLAAVSDAASPAAVSNPASPTAVCAASPAAVLIGGSSTAEPTPPATSSQAQPRGTEANWRETGTAPPQDVIERLIHARALRTASRESASRRNVAREDWVRLRGAERPHRQLSFFYFVLAGTAVLMMFMTLSSMAQRHLADSRMRQESRMFGILPTGPLLTASAVASRTICIDANQPQTRLGIDLAIFERARVRHTLDSATLRDPTPRAA